VTRYLLDTNVVVRLMEPAAPEHAMVKEAIRRLIAAGQALVLAPQVLTEFWVVATRPVEVNGFGWHPSKTADVITRLRSQFVLLDEGPAAFERWLTLVEAAKVRGKRAHDARLAAVMLSQGVTSILTLNTADFDGLPGVTALHPSAVMAGAAG
jgi:predicted nucleic acid-binding protein